MARKQAVTKDVDTVTLDVQSTNEIEVSQVERSREIARKRIQTGDTRRVAMQVPLRAQGEPHTTRWANTSISGRAYDLMDRLGWIPVKYSELRNPGNGEFQQTPDGHVSRGAGAHQVLYKIPTGVYKEIQRAKSEREKKRLGSRRQMTDGAAEAAGTAGHDRAAERIAKIGVETFEPTRSFEAPE